MLTVSGSWMEVEGLFRAPSGDALCLEGLWKAAGLGRVPAGGWGTSPVMLSGSEQQLRGCLNRSSPPENFCFSTKLTHDYY